MIIEKRMVSDIAMLRINPSLFIYTSRF